MAKSFSETSGFAEYEEIARFKGAKLDRLEAKHAWLDRTSLIMTGEHVTLGEADAEGELNVRFENKSAGKSGTGCVHTAPGHGADDFHISKRYGLEIYNPVDASGRFIAEVEHFGGMNIFEANPKIVDNFGTGTRRVDNLGTWKMTGAAANVVDVAFNNTGTVDIASGALFLNGVLAYGSALLWLASATASALASARWLARDPTSSFASPRSSVRRASSTAWSPRKISSRARSR